MAPIVHPYLCSQKQTLQHYNQAKPSFGEEVYFKLNLPAMILRRWIQLRANYLPEQAKNFRQKLNDSWS